MAAEKGDTVKVHYTGRLEDGTVFDSSEGGEPLEFTVGAEMVISGFDEGVEGMNVGDQKTVTIAPEEGYGDYDPNYVRKIPRDEINLGVEPQVGMELELRTPEGHAIPIIIKEVDDETVTLDANHPLAGHTLTFEIKRVD